MKDRVIGQLMPRAPAEFTHIRDIEYFEGPLTAEFMADDSQPYLFVWRDCDQDCNRWLVFGVTKRQIAEYEGRIKSMGWLISRALQGFIVDQNSAGEFIQWQSVAMQSLPDDYRSDDDAMFNPMFGPHPANGVINQQVLIDGEWTPADVADYPKQFIDAYSFLYTLSKNSADLHSEPREQRIANALNSHFDSGYVYRYFFDDLRRLIPNRERGRMRALNYSSPGVLELRVNEHVAGLVVSIIGTFMERATELDDSYKVAHDWLLQQKGSRRVSQIPVSVDLLHHNLDFICRTLGNIDLSFLETISKHNVRQYVEVILSYYRKVKVLAIADRDGYAIPLSRNPAIFDPGRKRILDKRLTDTELDSQADALDRLEESLREQPTLQVQAVRRILDTDYEDE